MKLEDILPELRKGRRAKSKSWNNFYNLNQIIEKFTLKGLINNNDYILEPEKKELSLEEIRAAYRKIFNSDGVTFNDFARSLGFHI